MTVDTWNVPTNPFQETQPLFEFPRLMVKCPNFVPPLTHSSPPIK